jgi:O-antigen ligase
MSTTFEGLPRRESGARPAPADAVTPRWLRIGVEAILWTLLIVSPLALGSVSELALALMEGTCFLLLLVGWWQLGGVRPLAPEVPLIAAAFVCWSFLQMVPLPPALLKVVSPGTSRLYSAYLPGYAGGEGRADLQSWLLSRKEKRTSALRPRDGMATGFEGRIEVRPGWQPISWYPGETLRWIFRFLGYGAFFLFIFRYLPETACRKRLPWLLLVLGFTIALLGIIQHFRWNGKIFWLVPVYQGNPFGPWVNSNHFSGYMEMVLPLGAAVLSQSSRRGRHRRYRRGRIPRFLLIVFFLAVMVVALVMAGSRGGLFSTLFVAGTYAAIQLARRGRTSRRPRLAILLAFLPLVMVVAGAILYTLYAGALMRPADPTAGLEPSFATRVYAWKAIGRMVAANPLTGTGLGTFAMAFPIFKTYGDTSIWQQAHNDYLQVLAESGAIGFALLAAGVLVIAWRYVKPIFQEPIRRQDPVTLGASFGTGILLIHSLVDFNLQIPSNGLLFVLCAALMIRGLSPVREGK